MTRDDILALQPGKELDAFVNELIFGECRHVWERHGPNNWNHRCTKCGKHDGKFVNQGLPLCGDDKKRSTDISAAFEVMEKMKNKTRWFGLDTHTPGYRAIFRVRNRRVDEDWYESFAETAPEAICKAALLAVLEEKP